MKHFLLTLLLSLLFGTSQAQDKTVCRQIVDAVINGINQKNTTEIKQYLATDFSCAGQSGPIAIMVLDQLIPQLNEHVADCTLSSERQDGNEFTQVYDFNYTNMLGHKDVTFVFDANNRLKRLDLIPVKVMTMPASSAPAKTAQAAVVTVPIEQKNGLIIVTAKINGSARKFILDTGSPTLVLNSAVVAAGEGKALAAAGVNSTIGNMRQIKVASFDFAGITLTDADVMATDLSHLLPGEEIYGLVGYSVIQDYDWLFDYAGGTLTLISPDSTQAYIARQGFEVKETELKMAGGQGSHVPYIAVTIGSRTINMGIDSGATGNLIDEKLLNSLEANVEQVGTAGLMGATSDTSSVMQATVKHMTIAGVEFSDVNTVFNSMSHLQQLWESSLQGLIGYEILSRQKTLVSTTSKRFMLLY